jgi:predicted O-methyltransferase YrrM
VLDWLRQQTGVPATNLAEGLKLKGPENVFDFVFSTAKHKKGNLKHWKNRYEELLAEINRSKPKRILEIGVWNGKRAIEMCSGGAEYVGFDLFEEATCETDAVEKNVKAHNSVEAVAKRLAAAGVKATLIKGNSRETVPAYQGEPFDLAFIDGGHSVETIRSDWEAVKKLMRPGGLVIFDDYYEGGIDTAQWGANAIVADLRHTLSSSRDPVAGGGVTRLAYVKC